MGGLSTDSKKRKAMWKEDVRMYRSHGLNPITTKLEKMMWKVPQYISAICKQKLMGGGNRSIELRVIGREMPCAPFANEERRAV